MTSPSPKQLRKHFYQLDNYDFEALIADLWEVRGWNTELTSNSRDSGIDVVATKENPFPEKQLIQAKRYSADNRIGAPEIRQYDSLRRSENNVDAVVIVTSSSYTKSAHQFAGQANLKLVDGEMLADLIYDLGQQGLVLQYIDEEPSSEDQTPSSKDNTQDGSFSKDGRKSTQETKDDEPLPSIPVTDPNRTCPHCSRDELVWGGQGTFARCQECRAGIKSYAADYDPDNRVTWKYFDNPTGKDEVDEFP